MGTITKALEMLNFFSRSQPELGLSDFVRLSGRDKATVHRHLTELAENGFVEQNSTTRAYRLGPAILRLTAVREATTPTRSLVRPIVEAMAEDVGELVHFSLLQGAFLSPIYHKDPGRHGTQVHFDEGEVLPLHATSSGLAVLAFAPDALRNDVLHGPLTPFTETTVTDPGTLSELIAQTARTGCARVEKGFDVEVASQAVPIFGPEGQVTGALAIAVPAGRLTAETEIRHADALRAGMARITAALGGSFPETYPA
ncbi:IclR family transcriptional regulator [Maritimibacter dapengensis]|uniref:IclR family transcriptional regulator n=1 Tax=Maritimibacter dapengensis TaxID=2836868 RepID=A0ABS6T4D3_9RHOB|nr:IclR family transcriptional regulator [Maritimibacter dapengensis]MBV7380009.1 IclR family transcriptional regulator [Maritimibacter dapengensis]